MIDPKKVNVPAAEDREPDPKVPPAGPHAKPELTNEDATPGAGTLPDPDDESSDAGISN